MAQLVLVHGIAQEQKTADGLETEWLPALAGGIRVAGYPEIADRIWRDRSGPRGIDARMAFYGHLFLRPVQQRGDAGQLAHEEAALADEIGRECLALTHEEAAVAGEIGRECLSRAAVRASKPSVQATASSELAYLENRAGTEPQGKRRFVRSAIRSLANISWFAPLGVALAERFVYKSLAQVTRYLTDEEIRRKALRAVLDLVGPETSIIVGHSLGSVIAYEAGHRLRQSLPLLVTLGSPLGLNTIVYPRLRPQPPAFPLPVRRWINIADLDDLIAAEPDLTSMFSSGIPPGAAFEGSRTVDNGAQPHTGSFYLGKAEVGKPVGEILAAVGRPRLQRA
jgi:hypothetical protein